MEHFKNIPGFTLYFNHSDLYCENKYTECLEYIHNEFFTNLEMAMSGAADELTAFEEKCEIAPFVMLKIDNWLNTNSRRAAGETENFQERFTHTHYTCGISLRKDSTEAMCAWPDAERSAQFRERCAKHKRYNTPSKLSSRD